MEKKIYNAPQAEVMFEVTVKNHLFNGSNFINVYSGSDAPSVSEGLAKGGNVDMGW